VTDASARVPAEGRHDHDRAQAAASRRTVTLGLLAAPGVASDLARALADELPALLTERHPAVEWHVVAQEEALVGAGGGAATADLVELARERLLAEGWDLVICLTDVPVLVRRRPVAAHASMTHGVGLLSVPALGAVALETRARDAVLQLVDTLLGERPRHGRPRRGRRAAVARRLRELASPIRHADVQRDERSVRFTYAVLRGNLRLLLGMLRANRPWALIIGLSRALVTAIGAGAFGMVSTGVWRVADGASWPRLAAVCVGAIVGTCLTLIVAHDLWERSPSPQARERVVLFNLATTLTVALGVLTLFAALLSISLGVAAALIAPGVLRGELRHAGVETYVRIALVLSMLATIGGGLGSALESDDVVREAAYGYRADD
jgi:hypothetical protein